MHWLFYSAQNNALARMVENTLDRYVPTSNLDRVYGFNALKEHFRRPQVSPSHIFLVISSQEELFEIKKFRNFILDMKCLIGLPSGFDQDFISQVFEFHPRYVARLPGDTILLELVLQKITRGHLLENREITL